MSVHMGLTVEIIMSIYCRLSFLSIIFLILSYIIKNSSINIILGLSSLNNHCTGLAGLSLAPADHSLCFMNFS